jgi:hypothetical protein
VVSGAGTRQLPPAARPPQHAITVHRDRLLVILRVAGFMTVDDVRRIAAEEQAAVRSLGVPSGKHNFLIDARALGAQAGEVVAFVQHTTDTVPLKPRRLAILVRIGMNSLQTRRMVGEREIGIFDNEDAAIAYLTA